MGLRITTWNVNGIRNPFAYQPWRENRTFQAMFDILEADIVIMQEVKIQQKDLQDSMVLVPGWDVFFSLPMHKKGYSGVAIYTRTSKCCPIRAEEGITGVLTPPRSSMRYRDLPTDQQIGGYPRPEQLSSTVDERTLDSEGRCVILEFPAFVLLGVYSPAMRDETRTELRESFVNALDARVRNLAAMGKQVVLTGDLNIIRSELDTAGLAEKLRKQNMSVEDFISTPTRRILNQILFGGIVVGDRDEGRENPVLWDLCREFHPTRRGMYTCWETKSNSRPGNYGSRIDYILCTSGIKDWFSASNIQEGLLGSDHCPVFATFSDRVRQDGSDISILDIVNPPGMFQDGAQRRCWSTTDLLPLSAKLSREFDRRQNIQHMFDRFSEKPDGFLQRAPSPGAERDPAESAKASLSSTSDPSSRAPNPSLSSVSNTPPETSPSPAPTSAKKRPGDPPASSGGPVKKSQTTLTKEGSRKSGPRLAQSSIASFLKPKTPIPGTHASLNPSVESQASDEDAGPSQKKEKEKALPGVNDADGEDDETGPSLRLEEPASDKFIDPFETRESWSKLLGKRIPPKCEGHGEPCISLVTKKPGMNCGRSFYICPRPRGPSGDKEVGTPFRCRTFIWSSDWNGSQ